jgi:hypothetical protein
MPTVTVYRAGPVEVGAHTGQVADLYAHADRLRPAGHPGRATSIYASPSLFGVTRWVRGNRFVRVDSTARELRVKPEGSYVYSVDAWEHASSGFGPTDERMATYWATGIPLSEWAKESSLLGLDPRNWEVLLPADAVLSARPVGNRRLITSIPAGDWTRSSLMQELEPTRWRRGTRW